MMRRGMIAILIGAMLLGGTGCKTDKAQKTAETLQGGKGWVSSSPLKLSIFHFFGNVGAFDGSRPVFKKAAELTNVSLEGKVSQSNSDPQLAFNIMMAANELADIIHYNKKEINTYGVQGAFIPLDELIEKHAPNIKKFFDENPWARKGSLAGDGKLYYIPYIPAGEAATGWFIREDWLQKLGLGVPKTVDEYYEVLKAFREKDPNGNGQKDEVPYFNRSKTVRDLYPLFGVPYDWYEKDGHVYNSRYTQEYKLAVKNVAKWYQEGLIDKEIFTRGDNARDYYLSANTGGSTHDWFGSTAEFNDRLNEKVPGIKINPIAPPADINGKVWEAMSRPQLGLKGWGISNVNKNPVETIKYFDFWYSEEGIRLNNFGVEGVHYTMENGKPTFKEEVLHGKEPIKEVLLKAGAQLEIGSRQDFAYEEQWLNPVAREGMRLYIDHKWCVPQLPAFSMSEQEEKEVSVKLAEINAYISEMECKWVLGGENVDDTFDKYLQNLKTMGMENIIKIYDNAYQNYIHQ